MKIRYLLFYLCISFSILAQTNPYVFTSTGETHLSFFDKTTEEKHDLYCYGTVTINENDKLLNLKSPIHKPGMHYQPIIFKDRIGEVKADNIIVHYSNNNGHINPEKMDITGNVQILQNAQIDPQDTRPVLQYAVADKVEFFPQINELVLQANPGQRVLFFDKIQDFKMSAEKVIIRRNPVTNKERVEGQGRVRFAFDDDEIKRLANIFQFKDKHKLYDNKN